MAVRGMRTVSDFEPGLQMAQINYTPGGAETAFLMMSPEYSFSSSLVKDDRGLGR
jgi:phosphopantetheine adenylyltransferase